MIQEVLSSLEFRKKYMDKISSKSKYSNVKVVTEYGTFDSKGEWKYFQKLLFRQNVLKNIKDLKAHEKFLLMPKIGKNRAITYTCDASYFDLETNKKVVSDFKSEVTAKKDGFILRKKMMLEKHGVEILIVCRKDL